MEKTKKETEDGNFETAESFAETVAQAVREQSGDSCEIKVLKIPGNNGIVKTALTINGDGHQASPLLYLAPYLKQYQEGYPLDTVIGSVCQAVKKIGMLPEKEFGSFEQMLDFQKVKGQVIYQLVNFDWNQKMLEKMPHKQVCGNLAVIFLLLLGQGKHGQVVAKITRRHMELWETDTEELWHLAETNTPKLQPVKLVRMKSILKELMEKMLVESEPQSELYMDKEVWDCQTEDGELPELMYVLSNTSGQRGAAAILYPDVLKRAAEQIGSDLLIFPASVHEVILVRKEELLNLEEVAGIVREVNKMEVLPEERLSDSIYCYSRSRGRMEVMEETKNKAMKETT